MLSLADADAFVFDVDGTLVLADDPNAASATGGMLVLRGAAECLRLVRQRGKRLALFTNGSGLTPHRLAERLRSAGIAVADDEVLTPPVVAAEYIRRHHPGQLVLAFGAEGVLDPLRRAEIPLAALADAPAAGVVLVGADPEFTYPKLEAACRAVWAGAPLLATSTAAFFASRGGRTPSISGAIAAGIRHVTGAEPIVVGKPAALVLEVAAGLLGTTPSRIAVVGDDLELEIRMARDAGAYTVLVLSGTADADDLKTIPPAHQPHLVVSAIGDLLELFEE